VLAGWPAGRLPSTKPETGPIRAEKKKARLNCAFP
jgi:hypothetical protein